MAQSLVEANVFEVICQISKDLSCIKVGKGTVLEKYVCVVFFFLLLFSFLLKNMSKWIHNVQCCYQSLGYRPYQTCVSCNVTSLKHALPLILGETISVM